MHMIQLIRQVVIDKTQEHISFESENTMYMPTDCLLLPKICLKLQRILAMFTAGFLPAHQAQTTRIQTPLRRQKGPRPPRFCCLACVPATNVRCALFACRIVRKRSRVCFCILFPAVSV